MGFNPFIGGGASEDKVARAEIAEIKDGETLDSFSDVETALSDKVDKETGKGLSTNDYTTTEKTKLAGIAEGAEVNEIQGIKVNSSTVNPDANKVVNITVPTSAADVSALPDTTKYAAALGLTINSSTFVMTGQLKDQNGDNLGTAQTIDLPLESVVVDGSYNSQTKKVVLTLQNGNTIEFSVADLVSGLQTELSATNKLNPAFIEYDSTHRAVSDTEKSTWNSKQNALSSTQLDAVNSGIDSTKVEQIETNKNNISYNINMGVKNLSPTNSGSATRRIAIPLALTAGKYTVYIGSISSTDTDDTLCQIVAMTGNTVVSNYLKVPRTTGGAYTFNVTGTSDNVYIYASDSYVHSDGDTVTMSDFMICKKAIYDADPSYQPYAMSNAELTAKEQQNENNISKNVAELVELVDSGAKSLVDFSNINPFAERCSYTKITDGYTVTGNANAAFPYLALPFTNFKAGDYVLKITVSAFTGADATIFVGNYSIGTEIASQTITQTGDISIPFTLDTDSAEMGITICPNLTATETQQTMTVSKLMICTKAAWDISHTYQPYRPNVLDSKMTRKQAITNGMHLIERQPKATTNPDTGAPYIYASFADFNYDFDSVEGITLTQFGIIYCNDGTAKVDELRLENVDGIHIIKKDNRNGSNLPVSGTNPVTAVGFTQYQDADGVTSDVLYTNDIGGDYRLLNAPSDIVALQQTIGDINSVLEEVL